MSENIHCVAFTVLWCHQCLVQCGTRKASLSSHHNKIKKILVQHQPTRLKKNRKLQFSINQQDSQVTLFTCQVHFFSTISSTRNLWSFYSYTTVRSATTIILLLKTIYGLKQWNHCVRLYTHDKLHTHLQSSNLSAILTNKWGLLAVAIFRLVFQWCHLYLHLIFLRNSSFKGAQSRTYIAPSCATKRFWKV